MAKARVEKLENDSGLEAAPELEERIGELRVLVYPYLPEVREADFYASVYRWYEGHPLADQVHRWVAVDGDEVVGHLCATPQYYRINDQRVVAHTPGDYMSLPQYGFQALSLMRHFFRKTENCVACDMVPAVIGVETRLGATVAGKLSYAAKLMDVSRLPTPPVPARLARFLPASTQEAPEAQQRYVPTPRPRIPLPEPAKKLLNGGLGTIDHTLGKAFGGDLEAGVIEEFDESFDELFEKVAATVSCIPEKDAAFLSWRYGPGSPQYPVTVIGVKDGNTLLGYAVLKVTIGSDGYILDLVRLPGRDDVARALLRGAVAVFRRAGAQIVRYRFLESSISAQKGDLQRLGFFYRNMRHNSLLVKFSKEDRHETARHIANWAYNVGDGEASFWTR